MGSLKYFNTDTQQWEFLAAAEGVEQHLGAADPHTQYVLDSGGTMTGNILFDMPGVSGSSGIHLHMKSDNPQILFEESDVTGAGKNYWIHHNSGSLYFLIDDNGDGSWNSPHPIRIRPEGNIDFGRDVTVDGSLSVGGELVHDLRASWVASNGSTMWLRFTGNDFELMPGGTGFTSQRLLLARGGVETQVLGTLKVGGQTTIDSGSYRDHLRLHRAGQQVDLTLSTASTLGINPSVDGLRFIDRNGSMMALIANNGFASAGRLISGFAGSQTAPSVGMTPNNYGMYYSGGGSRGSGAGVFLTSNGSWKLGLGVNHGVFAQPVIPSNDDSYTFGSSTYRWQVVRSAGGVLTSSDARLKKDIEDSDLGLEWVKRLQPRKYRIKDGARPHYGFIAQDIKALIDEVGDFAGYDDPTIDPTKSLHGEDDPGYLGLNYSEFIAPLVKAVQELSDENETQQAKIDDLEARLTAIEALG